MDLSDPGIRPNSMLKLILGAAAFRLKSIGMLIQTIAHGGGPAFCPADKEKIRDSIFAHIIFLCGQLPGAKNLS